MTLKKCNVLGVLLLSASLSFGMNEDAAPTDGPVQEAAPAVALTTKQRRQILREKLATFKAHEEQLRSDKVVVEGLQNATAAKKEKALAHIQNCLQLSAVMTAKIARVKQETHYVEQDRKELSTLKIRIGEGELEDYHIDAERRREIAQQETDLVANFSTVEALSAKADCKVTNVLGAVKKMIEHYQRPPEEKKD